MLGSTGEADDAVQECWLRVSRADAGAVENPEGWLTTVLARICLNILRSRKSRREEPLEEDAALPAVVDKGYRDPQDEALLAESVGLAMLVVLGKTCPCRTCRFRAARRVWGVVRRARFYRGTHTCCRSAARQPRTSPRTRRPGAGRSDSLPTASSS